MTKDDAYVKLFKEISQLEQKIRSIERERNLAFFQKRSDFRETYCSLEEAFIKMNEERNSDHVRLKRGIEKLRANVRGFRDYIRHIKVSGEGIDRVKERIEDIESAIANFKSSQRKSYDELLNNERICSQEVTALEKKFESLPTTTEQHAVASIYKSNSKSAASSMRPEVVAFNEFLESTGGMTGGWEQYDHGVFLRHRRNTSTTKLKEILSHSLPHKSEEAISAHIIWYEEYENKLESKRKAIAEWKSQKTAQLNQIIEEDSKEDAEISKEETIAKQKELQVRRNEDIRLWKERKERELQEKKEREEKERLMEKRAEEKRRLRQQQIKSQVIEFQMNKRKQEELRELEEFAEQLENAGSNSAQTTNRRNEFLKRDMNKVKQKLQEKKEREEEEALKQLSAQKRKESIDMKVQRDPSRILRPTKSVTSRMNSDSSKSTQPLLHIPHRAIPAWRADP